MFIIILDCSVYLEKDLVDMLNVFSKNCNLHLEVELVMLASTLSVVVPVERVRHTISVSRSKIRRGKQWNYVSICN